MHLKLSNGNYLSTVATEASRYSSLYPWAMMFSLETLESTSYAYKYISTRSQRKAVLRESEKKKTSLGVMAFGVCRA
jgi:hypothetical protein